MKFRYIAKTLAAVACIAALASCATSLPPALPGSPSVVIFLGDDHTAIDLGCYGSTVARTPNLDRLAADGLRFTRAFTTTAMCSPSRSVLYTGLHPHRNGCHMNHGRVYDGTRSLPHYLSALGYRVALSGKVHVKPRESFPFEYIRFARQRELDFDAMEEFMTDAGPFCLLVASNDPHTPHETGGVRPQDVVLPPPLVSTPETLQYYADYLTDVEILDREVGRVMKLLERHGLSEETLVIYAGDHGNGLFAKWTCYDMGIRVPFIARWPRVIAPGRVTDAMVGFVDVLPTLIEIAGGAAIPDLDGTSFLGVLTGETDEHRDIVFAAHTTRGIISGSNYPIRAVRDSRFKYIRNLDPSAEFKNIITHGRRGKDASAGPLWKSWVELAETDPEAARRVELYRHRPAEELYDLQSDPWEMRNLATSPAHATEIARLRAELDAWMERQGDRGMEAELRVKRD